MADSLSLVMVFTIWAAACVGLGAVFLRRAPAVSLALGGSLFGAVAGFLVGNADGPAEVPAYTALGASIGLYAWPPRAAHHISPRTLAIAPSGRVTPASRRTFRRRER